MKTLSALAVFFIATIAIPHAHADSCQPKVNSDGTITITLQGKKKEVTDDYFITKTIGGSERPAVAVPHKLYKDMRRNKKVIKWQRTAGVNQGSHSQYIYVDAVSKKKGKPFGAMGGCPVEKMTLYVRTKPDAKPLGAIATLE